MTAAPPPPPNGEAGGDRDRDDRERVSLREPFALILLARSCPSLELLTTHDGIRAVTTLCGVARLPILHATPVDLGTMRALAPTGPHVVCRPHQHPPRAGWLAAASLDVVQLPELFDPHTGLQLAPADRADGGWVTLSTRPDKAAMYLVILSVRTFDARAVSGWLADFTGCTGGVAVLRAGFCPPDTRIHLPWEDAAW